MKNRLTSIKMYVSSELKSGAVKL